jgi:phage-related holin
MNSGKRINCLILLASYIAIWILYLLLRIYSVSSIVEPKLYPDSKTYLEISISPITSSEFWNAGTPIITPLMYKLFAGDLQGIAIFQNTFSVFSWSVLAIAVAGLSQFDWMKIINFSLVLIFSLSAEILLWDWVILSESLSVSGMVLFLASWFWLQSSRSWKWYRTIAVIGVGILWMLTRDTNALLVFVISIFLLFLVLLQQIDIRFHRIALSFIIIFLVGFGSANTGGRWVGPNLNILSLRILNDPEKIDFYASQGMPINLALLDIVGSKARQVDAGFNDDPALDAFHDWHRNYGKWVYAKFLLSRPIETVISPISNISEMVYTIPLLNYAPPELSPPVAPHYQGFVFFEVWKPWIGWLIGTISIFSILFVIWLRERKWIVPLVFCGLSYPHAFVLWHTASPTEITRHAFQFSVQLRLSVLLLLLVILDFCTRFILQNFHTHLQSKRSFFIFAGFVMVIASLVIDFIVPGNEGFSIGYVQTFGLVVGLLSIYLGLRFYLDISKNN